MDTLPKLAPSQSLLLRTAARRADGRVIPPDTLRGGARVKVLTALLQRGWIEPAEDGHLLTDAGYAAIGQERPVRPDDVQSVDTIGDLQLLEGIPVRPGTKLAAIVVALRRTAGCDQPATDAGDWLAAAHRAWGDFRDAAQETRPERGAGSQRHRRTGVQGGVICRQGCPVSGGHCRYPGPSDASDTSLRNSLYACACARLTESNEELRRLRQNHLKQGLTPP